LKKEEKNPLFFHAISNSFKEANQNSWRWCKRQPIVIKPISCLWTIIVSLFLRFISVILKLGFPIDKIGVWLDKYRKKICRSIKNINESLSVSRLAYFTAPIKMTVYFPFAVLLGIIPQAGGCIGIDDEMNGEDESFFAIIKKTYFQIAKSLIKNSWKHGFWFFPIAFPISIPASLLAYCLGFAFGLLLWLDPVGLMVGKFKTSIVSISQKLASKVGDNIFYAFLFPILLVAIIFPVFLFLVLISFLVSEKEA
jgi:hypothetical protein